MRFVGISTQGTDRSRRVPQHEITVFLSPFATVLFAAWQRIHLVIISFVLLYSLSGITVIEANEVGVVLRLGKVTQSTGNPIVHPPGILYALPRPFDEVLKIEVDRIDTIMVDELAPPSWRDESERQSVDSQSSDNDTEEEGLPTNTMPPRPTSLDPEKYGYVLTADRNILHTQIIVRYRISNPVNYSLRITAPVEALRSVLLESTIKTAGATRLDDLLGGGRDLFTRTVASDAQNRLDQIGAGLEIVSIEFENLSPPEQVASDFDAVQSAYIEAQTSTQEANFYAAKTVPAAQADARTLVSQAEASSAILISKARAEADAFASLLPTYQANPTLVRHRLYREGVERALDQVGRMRFVPAPVTGGYQGTRFVITLPDPLQDRQGETQPPQVAENRLSNSTIDTNGPVTGETVPSEAGAFQ